MVFRLVDEFLGHGPTVPAKDSDSRRLIVALVEAEN